MSSRFCRFILTKLLGWTMTEPLIPEDKALVLAAPHTSIWDFVIGYLYYRALGGHLKVMIKKEAFFWPLGGIIRAMGGFPIDRKNPRSTVLSVIHGMESAEGKCILVICPEGTRKAVHHWKTGYHTIARGAHLPVYLGHFDYKKKEVGRGERFELGDDARADTAAIQQKYEAMQLTALHPDGYAVK